VMYTESTGIVNALQSQIYVICAVIVQNIFICSMSKPELEAVAHQ